MSEPDIIVDADTHIIESEAMWDLIDPDSRRMRPLKIVVPEDTIFGNRNTFWLIDGTIVPKPLGHGGSMLPTPAAGTFDDSRTDTSRECREITDVGARLRDMDRLGIDVQVVYPTLFLRPLTDDPRLEVSLCRAYNEWMARVHEASNGRIKWVVVPPLHSMSDALDEIRQARQRGAVGVFMRGIDAFGSLAEPAYFAVYDEAHKQDLPICIHSGIGSASLANEFRLETNSFTTSMPVLMAFRDLVVSRVPESFPGLRFAFVENGSAWLPYAFYQLSRRRKAQDVTRVSAGAGTYFSGQVPESAQLMKDYHFYVTCMVDEDLPYIMTQAAGDRMIVGSDYAHVDPAFQDGLVQAVRKIENVGEEFADDVLSSNPVRLYGLTYT